MMLHVPFYPNTDDGRQCCQVAMRSILKYVLNKDYSLEELDELTERSKGKWTSSAQLASALFNEGIDLIFYSKVDLINYLKGADFIRTHHGEDANNILNQIELEAIKRAVERILCVGIFVKKKVCLEEIEAQIKMGRIPILLVDYNILNRICGGYQGHCVVITGIERGYVYYHESGPHQPMPDKRARREDFIKAMDAHGTDNDCIIVKGKRQCEDFLSIYT